MKWQKEGGVGSEERVCETISGEKEKEEEKGEGRGRRERGGGSRQRGMGSKEAERAKDETIEGKRTKEGK